MKSIKDANFYNSRVFLRCDFNVPMEKGKVLDDFRIKRTLETIRHLKKSGAKIIIGSHFGKPQEIKSQRKRRKNFSLEPVKKRLEEILGEKIGFSKKITGLRPKMKSRTMKPGEVLFLENLRFDKREESGNRKFAEDLADLADVYVNEAFSVCHRNHASISVLPKLLPNFAGFELEKEVEILSKILKNPERPLGVIIGGIKTESKTKVIEKFLEFSDHMMFGGEVANDILIVKGILVGRPWPEEKIKKVVERVDITNPKIHLPIDFLVSSDRSGELYVRLTSPGGVKSGEGEFDIGEETAEIFSKIIKSCRTIFWSGPLGFFENPKFSQGTKKVAETIAMHDGISIAGGGETVSAIRKFGFAEKFYFVSSGGGAMLSFLSGDKMPGLEVLE